MTEPIFKILQMLGVNRAIGFGVLTRFWSAIATPLTMLIIASRFSGEQQGYFYTFSSLLALQLFFELGLTSVITQFSSHEFAFLEWGHGGRIEGDLAASERVLDLLGKSVKWFGIAALLLMIVLIPAGLLFFSSRSSDLIDFSWRLPWFLAVTGIAINLIIVPFYAVILGSGDVVSVNQREMFGGITGSLLAWTVILSGGGLYAVSAVTFGNAIIAIMYLLKQKPLLVRASLHCICVNIKKESTHSISWWKDVWPVQWRSAISWISGYFVFQLFTPVLFHYHGPVVAGQMGMSLSLANGIAGVGLTWLVSHSPQFGKHIALAEWIQLDTLFFKVIKRSTAVVFLGVVFGSVIVFGLQQSVQIGQRFLPAPQVVILFASVLVQALTNGFGVYLRAHKKEPFAGLMVVWAIIQAVTTWSMGKYLSSFGVVSGYLIVNLLLTLPVTYFIWQRCRRAWHPFRDAVTRTYCDQKLES